MMRPARTAKNEKRCLSAGTVVSVKARIFDDEGVDEESRWSSQFAAKGEETLRGTVVSHYKWCHDPVVRYEYDGKPVSTKLKDLTIIEIVEQPAVPSPFEFDDAPLPIHVTNRVRKGKRPRPADADEDNLVVGINLPENRPESVPDSPDPGSSSPIIFTELIPRDQPSTSDAATEPLATVDTGNSSSAPEKKRTRVKKNPIYTRPVCSLAAAEVEANYTMRVAATTDATASHPHENLTTLTKGKSAKDADRTTRYSVKKNLKVKRAEQDIVIGKPGVIPEARNLKDPVSAFDFYFTGGS